MPITANEQRQQIIDARRCRSGAGGQTPITPFDAAGQRFPLEHDRPDDLREGERQHREIDAGKAHREPAEQQRADERDERRGDQRQAHRHRQPFHQQRRTVGTEAEICGMTERMHAARPHDEMQRGRKNNRDQNVDTEHQADRESLAPAAAGTAAARSAATPSAFSRVSPAGSDLRHRHGAHRALRPAEQPVGPHDQHDRHHQEFRDQRELGEVDRHESRNRRRRCRCTSP